MLENENPNLPPKWWKTKKGNYCRKIDGKYLTVYKSKKQIGYDYVFENSFSDETYAFVGDAIRAAEEEYT